MNVHYIIKNINPTGRNTNTLFKQNISQKAVFRYTQFKMKYLYLMK